jgi:ABC-type branched-subunit amino acid transport system substrate-binding protein
MKEEYKSKRSRRSKRIRRAALAILAGLALNGSAGAGGPPAPLVVGLSVMNASGPMMDSPQLRFMEGAKIYLKRVNAEGGIDRRQIELVPKDDGGVPARYLENMRSLASEQNLVALLGCYGEALCLGAAEASAALKVPLIGAMSGSEKLTRQTYPLVFRVRADYAREALAVATQLSQLGSSRVALLTDQAQDKESDLTFRRALEKKGISVQVFRVSTGQGSSPAETIQAIGAGGFHAAVVNVGFDTMDKLINANISETAGWPAVLFAVSNGTVASLTAHFKDRSIAFTQVVPHPDLLAHPLAREFVADASQYAANLAAFTPEGMEGYVSARLLVFALRKPGPKNALRLGDVLKASEGWDLNNFHLNFGSGRANGSDWVGIGLRSRGGAMMN